MDQEISDSQVERTTAFPNRDRHTYLKRGGAWFGLIFGLSYALIIWGRHAYQLWRNSVALPWLEIVVGLILCSLVWAIAGYLSGLESSVGKAILLSITAGVATPWLIWMVKTLDENLVWLADRENWSFVVHCGDAYRVRLFFISLWGIGVGGFAGALQRWLIPHAWDLTSSSGRTSLKSLGVFLLCLPLTIVFGSVSNDLLHNDLHKMYKATFEGHSTFDPDETKRPLPTWSYGNKNVEVTWVREWPQGDFVIHPVDYNAESMDQFFIDVIYAEGITIRCQGGRSSMRLCGNVSETFRQQMDHMIQSGLSRELEDLRCAECDPYIKPEVIASLYHLRSSFTENYDIIKNHQYGGAVTMIARFDTGYEMICRFRGEDPIVVESCTGQASD